MDFAQLLVSLVSGAVGGNVAGAAAPDKSLGTVGNSIAGLFGGAAGGYIMTALGLLAQVATAVPAEAGGVDIASLLSNVGGSGVAGALLTFIVGWIKNNMAKS